MSKNKKPRKAYRARPITADTMALAMHYAAKPSDADLQQVMSGLAQAITALRQGVATEHQWSIVSGSVSVALAIEEQGVVRGLKGHFDLAEKALQDIYNRAMVGCHKWMNVTLYYQEIDALQTFSDLHQFQIDQLGRREFLRAIDAAQKSIIAQGHKATIEKNIERMAA